MNKEIKLFITIEGMKLISVNALYKAGLIYRGGKPVPYIYKDSIAKKFESQVKEQLRSVDLSEHIGWLTETKQFSITNQYILKSGINRRDLSNLTKLSDDVFVKFFKENLGISHFDDSEFVEEHLYKSILPGSEHEYLCISIRPSVLNVRYDKVTNPTQAIIHYSKDNLEWETKDFKKSLKEKGIKYQPFDTDKKIKDDTDTNIFLIDSSNTSRLDLVTDVLDFIYSHKDNGFTYYGFYMRSDKDIVDKINSFGLSNVRAGLILDGDLAGFINNTIIINDEKSI